MISPKIDIGILTLVEPLALSSTMLWIKEKSSGTICASLIKPPFVYCFTKPLWFWMANILVLLNHGITSLVLYKIAKEILNCSKLLKYFLIDRNHTSSFLRARNVP